MSFASRRTRIAAATSAGVVAGLAVAALAVPTAQAATSDLTLVSTQRSLLGTHQWYAQTYAGHDVLGGYYARHTDTASGTVTIQDGRRDVGSLNRTRAAVGRDQAVAAATGRTASHAFRSDLVVVPGERATLAYAVISENGKGQWRTLVDAGSGAVLKVDRISQHADGQGRVFDPHPVATLQDDTLTDQNDADYPALAGAYKNVTLTQLDGSGNLDGAYATNVSKREVSSATGTFLFNRSQREFEQVMAYYGITSTQEYIQGLGFTGVNNEAQNFRTTGYKADNSYYSPSKDQITSGTGGVDDAEDLEVVWHEYGHAIQDAQVPNFGSSHEGGSIGEGFGDWWAMIMSVPNNPDTATTPLACIADWDAVSYDSTKPYCLRRIDGTKIYPDDMQNSVHRDGEIWSRALWDIYQGLGRDQSATIVLEAQFSYAPNTSFRAAAQTTVDTARRLYGEAAATTCQNAFAARGIL